MCHQNQPPEVELNPVKHIKTVTGLWRVTGWATQHERQSKDGDLNAGV